MLIIISMINQGIKHLKQVLLSSLNLNSHMPKLVELIPRKIKMQSLLNKGFHPRLPRIYKRETVEWD